MTGFGPGSSGICTALPTAPQPLPEVFNCNITNLKNKECTAVPTMSYKLNKFGLKYGPNPSLIFILYAYVIIPIYCIPIYCIPTNLRRLV